MLATIIMGMQLVNAAPVKDTKFYPYMLENYGFELISYEITDKYSTGEQNDLKFVILDVVVKYYDNYYQMTWIMTKEKYNELDEKV
jgi:hypothetical protein